MRSISQKDVARHSSTGTQSKQVVIFCRLWSLPFQTSLEDGLTTEEYNRGWTGFILVSKRTEPSTNVNKIMSCPKCGERKKQILPVKFPQYFPREGIHGSICSSLWTRGGSLSSSFSSFFLKQGRRLRTFRKRAEMLPILSCWLVDFKQRDAKLYPVP